MATRSGSATPSSTAHPTASTRSSCILPPHSLSPALRNDLPYPVEHHRRWPVGSSLRARQVALYGQAVAGGEGDGLHPGEVVPGEVGAGVEEVLAALVRAVVGVEGGAAFVGGEGYDPVLVSPVPTRHGEVTAVQAAYGLEVFPDAVIQHDPLCPGALHGGGLYLVGLGVGHYTSNVVA